MDDIKEPSNMYDPYSFFPYTLEEKFYNEQLDEVYEEIEPDEFIDLENLYNLYNT